ncbi:hypothetical protein [Vreelandella hamiltonii]|uniref:Sugar phosphate isomerase/epimerase n=1 Tax=Halomonas johnsoniae TaxID=502832 RepID=A0ABQ2WLA9_9GAMM|nr:hypothetical protein [Halomonas johnsoniae]GGW57602.1 hypothetical protein GCM10007158_18440 [Halomonas johnsoniae]
MAKSFISVSTAAFDGYGFDAILPSLARCGVKNVELAFIDGYVEAFTDSDFSQDFAHDLSKEMRRYGQQCRYFSGHIDLGLENAASRLEARCRFAAWLGAEFIITNAAVRENMNTCFSDKPIPLPQSLVITACVFCWKTLATVFPTYLIAQVMLRRCSNG